MRKTILRRLEIDLKLRGGSGNEESRICKYTFLKNSVIFLLGVQQHLETSRKTDSGIRRLASMFLPELVESSQL